MGIRFAVTMSAGASGTRLAATVTRSAIRGLDGAPGPGDRCATARPLVLVSDVMACTPSDLAVHLAPGQHNAADKAGSSNTDPLRLNSQWLSSLQTPRMITVDRRRQSLN